PKTGNQTIFISQPNKDLKDLMLEVGNSLFSNRVK
ncbi:unnamed protein product, partial [marine sediment metagenome]